MHTIRFGESFPDLQYYEDLNWKLNETYEVEFFPNDFYSVSLISANSPRLNDYLNEIDIQEPIALDLEWEDEISSLQFGIDKKVLIIRHAPGSGNKLIYDFLNTHYFFAKGTRNDTSKLYQKFGNSFDDRIEDIEKTRLIPYNHSLNFSTMTLQFAGKPTAEFKDIRITKSNWDLEELTMRQVLYAAFDVVAIFKSYPNFPVPKTIEKKQRQPSNGHNEKRKNQINLANPIKINKKERQISLNEWKANGHKIFLKQSFATEIYCYIISNYQGSNDFVTIQTLLKSFISSSEIDNVSCFCFENNKYLFISTFFQNKEKIFEAFPHNKIIEIPKLNPKESSDYDVLFLYDIPQVLHDQDQMWLFLNCFGCDHRISNDNNFNVRVQPHCAQSSLRMKHFIPYLFQQDGNQILKISTFPFYLPKVRATFPSFYSNKEDISLLFNSSGTVQDISLLRKRSPSTNLTAIITFSNAEEAGKCVNDLNYKEIEGKGKIYVQRYTDENHMRFLRFHELLVTGMHDERQLRKHFEKYGKILQAVYDPLYNISRVFYYEKSSALLAAENEVCARCVPLSTMAFIRELPLSITNEEVLDLIKPYGKTLGFAFRDITESSKTAIVEVMYSAHEEALKLKAALHHSKMGKRYLEVNASTLDQIETPTWKMQQRRRWITFFSPLTGIEKENEEESNNGTSNNDDQDKTETISEHSNDEEESLYESSQEFTNESSQEFTNKSSQESKIAVMHSHQNVQLFDLVKRCEQIGPIIDIKLFSAKGPEPFLSFNELNNYSKIFIQFLDSIYQTQSLRRIKDFPIHESTITEFVKEILPEKFYLPKIEIKNDGNITQPYALVITNRPKSLTRDALQELFFNNRKYNLYFDDTRVILYVRTNRIANCLIDLFKRGTEKIFSNDEKFIAYLKNRLISRSTVSISYDEFVNDQIAIKKFLWYQVPNRPPFHPFQRSACRKMSIVIDPVSKDTTAHSIRQFCSDAGVYDIKIDGSAVEIGKRRVVIRPRNAKAKVACFSAFESDLLNGCKLTPCRMKKEDIPPPLKENLDDLEYD